MRLTRFGKVMAALQMMALISMAVTAAWLPLIWPFAIATATTVLIRMAFYREERAHEQSGTDGAAH